MKFVILLKSPFQSHSKPGALKKESSKQIATEPDNKACLDILSLQATEEKTGPEHTLPLQLQI